MSDFRKFYISGLVLTVYDASYLVEVEQAGGDLPQNNQFSDLPEWVFRSKNAIWLAVENAPVLRRALDGEMIKKKLVRLSGPSLKETA